MTVLSPDRPPGDDAREDGGPLGYCPHGLILQRRFSGPTSLASPPLGETPLAMAGSRPAIPLLTPRRPPEDLGHVPGAHLQQVGQQRPHLGHRHPRLFFPPAAASATPGRPAPASTTPYGGASPTSPASRTRPARIDPCPT